MSEGKTEAHRVLIIDDEESIRDSCSQVLKRQGLEVETACDGESGLKMLDSFKPDVVLLDLKMPGIQGIDVLKELKKVNPDGVIIIITGYPTLESCVESMKCGAYDYLPKPFGPDELRVVVQRAVERCGLIKKLARLEQEKERVRNNFIAMASHQLKVPLVAVSQYIEVLAEGIVGALTEQQKQVIERIRVRVAHLLKFIEAFLRLSRFESSGDLCEVKEVDLCATALDAWTMILDQYADKKMNFMAKITEEYRNSYKIKGDSCLIFEMFANLFSNSMKYTPENGTITVEFLPPEEKSITVKVSDTGQGIPEEEQPFIFTEFFRGSAVKAVTDIPGTGLGLSTVKRIVEAHKGRIFLESGRNKGATFILKFPTV